jgi:prepilin-type N-terminal cleavage/methylation domain-containing protein
MTRRPRRRAGFSLVEVIMALTMLAVAMMMLARLSYLVSQRGRSNDLVAKRNAALQQEAGRYGVMSFTDLAKQTIGTTTTSMLVGDFSFTRKVTVSMPGTNRYTITVTIVPVASEFKSDSVTFRRTRPATGNPLCTSC